MSLIKQGQASATDVTDLNYQLPTDDGDVRSLLRSLQEPITLFGEDKADRRSRLIKLISNNHDLYQAIMNDDDVSETEDMDTATEMELDKEEYYEPVSEDPVKCDELYDLRINLTKISLKMAKSMNARQMQEYENFNMIDELQKRRTLYDSISNLELSSSKMISDRPVSKIQYYQDEIITTSWSGDMKIFQNDEELTQIFANKEPEKISKFSANDELIITGNFQGDLNFYSHQDLKHLSTLSSLHESRISDLKIHPFIQNLVITSSFDKTFKLFDLTKQQESYQQHNTHRKEIFAIGLNKPGSLLSTCGLDSAIRVWDLRSGKAITTLMGHQSGVYCIDWHSNGFQMVSGSNDCTVKIWDLRNPTMSMVNLPIHDKLVSDVKISECGKWFISSGYDNKINVTSFDSFVPLAKLIGHDDKIMTVDIKDKQIISSGWDRSLKIWN